MSKRRGNGEGSISGPRSDGRFEVKWTDQDGKRRTAYARSRPEAATKLREALDRVAAGAPAVETRDTFRAAAEAWRRTATARHGMRTSSLETYSRVLRCQAYPRIGDVPMRDLRASHVVAMLAAMEEAGLSASYRSTARKVVGMVCDAAIADGHLRSNPVRSVKAPSVPAVSERKVVPDREQVRALIEGADSPRLRIYVALLAYTGMRAGEVLALRWSNWDGAGTLSVMRGKSKKPRAVPVVPALAAELRAWRAAQTAARLAALVWDDRADLIVTTNVGTAWHDANARKAFRALANGTPATDSAPAVPGACPGASPHSLRHAAATILLEEGVPMRVVADLLGHASERTTSATYSHVSARLTAQAGDALGRALG